MPLGKRLGKPPREVAVDLLKQVTLDDLCQKPEIAGPGFINLRLRDEWLTAQLNAAVHVSRDGPIELIAMGGDVRFAVRQLQPEWDGRSLARLSLKGLEEFTNKILGQSEDRIVRKYRLSYPEAETLGPALLAYVLLAKELQITSVLVSNVNLRDGLLTEMAESDAWSKEFGKQIIRSAVDLGRKFNFDEQHDRRSAPGLAAADKNARSN